MTNRRFVFFMIAVAACVFGVMTGNFVAIGVGLLAMAIAFRGLPDSSTLPNTAGRYLGVICAVILGEITILLVVREIDNFAIPILWAASMLLYLVGVMKLDGGASAEKKPPLATDFWKSHGRLIPVILIAFALRIYDLEYLPPLYGDEGEMGLAALQVLENKGPPIVATGWLDHPAFFHYLQAIPVAIFGRTGLGLRLLSVIAGVLCVPLVYQLGRLGWGALAGLVAAWLMAISHLHIHFSRIGLNNIDSTFTMLFFLALLARSRRQQVAMFGVAGLVVGLSQYLYHGSRLILVVAPLLLFFTWKKKMAGSRQIATLALGILIAVAPLATFYITHPQSFYARNQGVYVLTEKNMKHTLKSDEVTLPDDAWPLLKEQVARNLSFFLNGGDRSAFYLTALPAFDPLTAIMFWLGLGVALIHPRRYPEFSVLSWLGLGIILGGVLTIDAPNAPRLLIVTPCVFLLGGALVQRVETLLAPYPERLRASALLIALVLTGYLNYRIYFHDFTQNLPARNLAVDAIAREIRSAGQDYTVFLLGQPNLSGRYGPIRFLAGDQVKDLDDPENILPLNEKGLLIIALPDQAQTLEEIKGRIPGGASFTRVNHLDNPLYSAYYIPAHR